MKNEKKTENKRPMIAIPRWIWERTISMRTKNLFFHSLEHVLLGLQQPFPPRIFKVSIKEIVGDGNAGITTKQARRWYAKKDHPGWRELEHFYPGISSSKIVAGETVEIVPNFDAFKKEHELFVIWDEADTAAHQVIEEHGGEDECPFCSLVVCGRAQRGDKGGH